MALTDISFQDVETQDFLVELPVGVQDGSVDDIVVETNGTQFLLLEVPLASGGNIFIMSE